MTKNTLKFAAVTSIFPGSNPQAHTQFLGSADTFAVSSGTTVTNTGPTLISGDVGVSPGNNTAGFTPGTIINGTLHSGDAAAQAQTDALTAYNTLSMEAATTNLTGQNLGGMTLFAGVYHFDTSAALTGILILDTQGNPNARFDFQIGTTLATATNYSVIILNSPDDHNIFFQVGTSATLNTGTAFASHVLAATSITLGTGASHPRWRRTGAERSGHARLELDKHRPRRRCPGTFLACMVVRRRIGHVRRSPPLQVNAPPHNALEGTADCLPSPL